MKPESWAPISDFPEYLISNYGRIYNTRTQRVLNQSPTTGGALRVTLINGEEMATRSVVTLVADAFVQRPHDTFDTVVQLDGSHDNVIYSNLVWRPRWFALKYRNQFEAPGILRNMSEYTTGPIRNCVLDRRYPSIALAAMAEGVLAENILEAIRCSSTIWPFDYFYEWV